MTTSKQKHKLLPLVIYNPLIPVKGFLAMVTIFILWIRSEYKGDTRRLNERFLDMKRFMYINRLRFGLHLLL